MDAAAKREFDYTCNEIGGKILDRLSAHEQILRSGAAFFERSGGVNRQEWRRFTDRQKVEQQLPGIQGIGFALLIPREQLAQHVQEIRAEGFPAYQVRPEGERETYSSILYLEPFTNRNLRAFGYDMLSEPVRRAAMERARDQDAAALSGKVRLVQETDKDIQAGTLMYVPVYHTGMPCETVVQRRAALLGWVYSPYRMNDLMRGILGRWDLANDRRIRLEVFDGEQPTPETLLYDSQSAGDQQRGAASRLALQSRFVSAGRPWTLRFTRIDLQAFTMDYGLVWLVLFGGTSTTLLLSWLFFNLLNTRFKVWQMARHLTTELRQSEGKYRLLIENSHDILYMLTSEGVFTFVSPAWPALLGHPVDQVVGKSYQQFVHADDIPGCMAWLKKVIETGQRQEGIEYRVRHSDGSWRWHTSSAVPLRSEAGTVIGFEGTARDITERKRAETYRDMGIEVLQILNEPGTLKDSIQRVVAAIQMRTGFDAVGMRLQDGDDFPYFVQGGFSKDFLLTENTLTERCAEGGVCRDKDGNVRLECTCGLVLSGKTDPAHPLFTRGGSFWINDSFPLLKLPSDQDPRLHPRNRCIHQGYASVALVPIRIKNQIVGLLQLNDRRKGWFSLTAIEQLEGIAAHIGAVLIRRRAEDALRASAERLSLATRAGGVGIWDYDLVHNTLTWDDQMFKLYGITRESFDNAYEAWKAGVHPEDRQRGDEEVQLALRGEKDFDTEFRVLQTDGTVRNIRALATVNRDASGQPLHMIGTNWDITDQKRLEEKLKSSEANFRAFFKSMTDMIMVGTLDGRVLFTNAAVTQTLGYTPDELSGMHMLALHPADRRREAEAIFAAMFKGERESCPLPLARKDGSLVPVETRAWFGRWNGVDCIFGISKNLTAEQEAQQRFERLFRNNPALMALSTLPDRRFSDVNDTFLKRLGYARGDILGKTADELGLFPHPEQQSALADKLQTDGRIADFELQVRRKDGAILDGLFSGDVIDSQGRQYFLTVMSDITDRKRAEEELQKMQKLQSIGTLAGGIAHDFNNILMGLFGNIFLAKDELPKDHPCYTLLEEAEKSMNRAVRLTKQLLTFAKGGDPVKEVVSLGAIIEEVGRFDLSGSEARLVFRQVEDLWPAEVDHGQIQQVISNLAINARQAMPNGGRLYISLENADIQEDAIPGLHRGKYVKVTMRDEGTGIEQKHLGRIFDPYFSTKQTGSGLGLAMAYSIVQKHGGHISVVSELDKGTTFTFYLPASKSPQQAETKPPAAEGPALARPARILVMDDEKTICSIIARMLTQCGFTVATAPGGQEAIEMYKQALEAGAPFDAVIMDLTIPGGIGGKEAIKDLLAIDPQVRAIVSSGYAGDPVMANYAEYGFKGIAAKPYTQSKLLEVLAQVLKPEG